MDLDLEVDSLVLGDRPERTVDELAQVGQADLADVDVHAPGFHLGEVEDVVHERELMAPGRLDVLDVVGLTLVELAEHALRQDVGEADDRIQRRPQLMRHVREEFALGTISGSNGRGERDRARTDAAEHDGADDEQRDECEADGALTGEGGIEIGDVGDGP